MASARINDLIKNVEMARTRFLFGLDRTPDDRLNWSPGGEAPTPLQVAGKIATYAGFFAGLLRGEPPAGRQMPPAPETREAAKELVDSALRTLASALGGVSEEDFDRTYTAPWGAPVTIGEMIWWLPLVCGYAQGQLNLIQLSYGDTDPNIPDEWKQQGNSSS